MVPLTCFGTCALEFNCMIGLSKVSSSSSSESADIETSEAESSFSIIEVVRVLDDDSFGLALGIFCSGNVVVEVPEVDVSVPEGMSLPGVSILNQVWRLGSFLGMYQVSRKRERVRKLTLVKYFADLNSNRDGQGKYIGSYATRLEEQERLS